MEAVVHREQTLEYHESMCISNCGSCSLVSRQYSNACDGMDSAVTISSSNIHCRNEEQQGARDRCYQDICTHNDDYSGLSRKGLQANRRRTEATEGSGSACPRRRREKASFQGRILFVPRRVRLRSQFGSQQQSCQQRERSCSHFASPRTSKRCCYFCCSSTYGRKGGVGAARQRRTSINTLHWKRILIVSCLCLVRFNIVLGIGLVSKCTLMRQSRSGSALINCALHGAANMDDVGDDEIYDDGFDSMDSNNNNGQVIADLTWRVAKLRLEEQHTARFLKSQPRFLPYDDCRKWVQAWGSRWQSEEDWRTWISLGEKRNSYIPSMPDEYYQQSGDWRGWNHFLGCTENDGDESTEFQ
ncbi:hypothetical protein MPSEU_000527900 [Mayamaea pseudoterrestris]|nr:hypothetical protein MPSEU_000527900 [Mayamaea pseudoterrestris]